MTPRDPLRDKLRQIRAVEPSPELEARLMQRLAAERRAEQSSEQSKSRASSWVSNLRISLPALASVAVAAHFAWHDPSPEALPFTEHRLELPSDGALKVPLSFSLDEHDTEFATLRLDVPHGLSLSALHESVTLAEPDCHHHGCVYEFVHPTTSVAPHVEVHVTKPGRYQVKVEHQSTSKLLREVVVVHASR